MLDRFSIIILFTQMFGQSCKVITRAANYVFYQGKSSSFETLQQQSFTLMVGMLLMREQKSSYQRKLVRKCISLLMFIYLVFYISLFVITVNVIQYYYYIDAILEKITVWTDNSFVYYLLTFMAGQMLLVYEGTDFINGILIMCLFYLFGKNDYSKKKAKIQTGGNIKRESTSEKQNENDQRISGNSASTADSNNKLSEVKKDRISLYKDLTVYYEQTNEIDDGDDEDSLFIENYEDDETENSNSFSNASSLQYENFNIRENLESETLFKKAGIQ
ncbi:UNKNOWN [Stylonychia lemnae]|uniref:Uncharacterized protein n=1 Tax=Stylonychia lemnae TaxID=5949 RepID=A0A078AUJ7_STYLE|nr:UNKNOWN [Stylonychia lemnae]|eukprot:CDW86075.1 UNKNOWN [Stylonychia lemnae]